MAPDEQRPLLFLSGRAGPVEVPIVWLGSSGHCPSVSHALCHLSTPAFLGPLCLSHLSLPPPRPHTCVCSVGLVASAAVNDQLQLPVELVQPWADKGQIWLPFSSKSHSSHFPCHIPGAQGGSQVRLLPESSGPPWLRTLPKGMR